MPCVLVYALLRYMRLSLGALWQMKKGEPRKLSTLAQLATFDLQGVDGLEMHKTDLRRHRSDVLG